MNIDVGKFGKMLISRPAGREAFLAAKAYIFDKQASSITLDFSGVDVMTPSWLDEFITGTRTLYPSIFIEFKNTDNESVKESLVTINAWTQVTQAP